MVSLLEHYHKADAATREAGRRWYPEARAICEAIAGDELRVETVARVMAILSPRTTWEWNVRWTRMICAAYLAGLPCPAVGTKANRDKAWRELHGERALSGPKTAAFARAILGDENAVVIDSWVLRSVGLPFKANVTPKRRRWITEAYATAAQAVKETPRDMQAIVWCQVRGKAE